MAKVPQGWSTSTSGQTPNGWTREKPKPALSQGLLFGDVAQPRKDASEDTAERLNIGQPRRLSSVERADLDRAVAALDTRPKYQSFGSAFMAGLNDLGSLTSSAIEATGEITGADTLAEVGKYGREMYTRGGEEYGPRGGVTDIQSVSDAFAWASQTAGNMIPVMLPSIAGGIATGGAGTVGAMAGAFVPSAGLGIGEVQQNVKDKDPEAKADGWVFVGGSAIGALDALMPGQIGGKLVQTFGRKSAEEIALRALLRPASRTTLARTVAKEAGKDALLEGLTESVQEAIGEVAASKAANQDIDWGSLPERMVESAAAGALMGGFAGGSTGLAEGRAGRAEQKANARADSIEAERAAVEAFDPILTDADRASPLGDEKILAGKRKISELLGENPFKDRSRAPAIDVAPKPMKAPPPSEEPRVRFNPDADDERATFKAKVRTAETSGNDRAKNPNSTASGRYQFTKGTWESLGGDWKDRFDVDEQERLMDRLTDQNQAALQKAGIPETAGNFYLAHFAGSGGAVAVHKNPSAPVEKTLGAAVVKANPFLKGMSGQQVIDWAARKMGGQPSSPVADTAPVPTGETTPAPELTRKTGLDRINEVLGEDITAPTKGERVAVTRDGQTTEGTVEEAYGEGAGAGVRIKLADGTIFDETLADAREYGARITRPVEPGQIDRPNFAAKESPAIASIEGEKINAEFTSYSPESGTLGIPRSEMPQIKAENRGALANFLKGRGIASEEVTLPATDIKPTQAEFSPAKVAKAREYQGGNRAILISSDNHVIDGHHQWQAAREAGEDVRAIRVNAPIREALATASEMPSAEGGMAEKVKASGVTYEDTASGKGFTVSGLSDAQKEAISQAVPKARGVPTKSGGLTFSKKHEAAIRDAVAGAQSSNTPASKQEESSKSDGLPPPYQMTESGEAPKPTGTRPETERAANPTAPGSIEQMPGKRTLKEHFTQGWNAAEAGWSIEDDPYLATSSASDNWRKGFRSSNKIESRKAEKPKAEALKDRIKDNRAAKGGAAKMQDWSDTIIPNPDDAQRRDDDGGITKERFLKDAKDYLSAVSDVLTKEGFEPKPGAKITRGKKAGQNKPGQSVRVSEAGPASSGDVYLEMYPPADGDGVYVNIGTALAGPKGGISLMARTVDRETGRSGPNQWWPVDLSASELADRLMKLAKVDRSDAPAKAEKKAPDPGYRAAQQGLKVNGVGPDLMPVEQAAEAARKAEAAIWNQKDFKSFRKAIGDPARESQVGALLMMGWRAGKAGTVDALIEQVNRANREAEGIQGNGDGVFNPTQPFIQAYYAAATGKTADVRTKGGFRDVLSPDQVLAEVQGKPTPPTNQDVLKAAQDSGRLEIVDTRKPSDGASIEDMLKVRAKRTNDRLDNVREDYRREEPEFRYGRLLAEYERTKPAASASDYGANNKLVTQERAAELRARLKEKLSKAQLNAGIDPEMLMIGAELAVFHIEAGSRRFREFAKAIASDLDMEVKELRRHLRGWYNGARDTMEDSGESVAGMDTPDEVGKAMRTLEDWASLSVDNGGIDAAQEKTDAESSTPSGTRNDDRAGDERSRPADAQGIDEPAGGPAERTGEPREDGAADVRGSDERGADGNQPGGREAGAATDDRADDGGAQRSVGNGDSASNRVRSKRTERGTDYSAPIGSLKREGGWKATAERNLDIIELVNRLDAEKRPATAEEQKLLASFTGWGAGEIRNNLFRNIGRNTDGKRYIVPQAYGPWADLTKRAAELLTGETLETALQSTQYAHYTSEEVIRSIWQGVERMGFTGGRILEPGMGNGLFAVAAPAEAMGRSHYTGIEMDKFTAKVAGYLLPQENVLSADYTKTKLPDGFFDLAIGNPPFADVKVLSDPAYKKQRFSLHDYFFAKSLDKVRPGGFLVFVTSRYTMDKLDPKARKYMAERADLVGAIRLPQTAFKENAGTEVVTDVIILQRRAPGQEPGGEAWTSTDKIKANGHEFQINEYFKAHPEMVLGKHSSAGSMYSANEYTVEPYKEAIEKSFAKAIARLPENIYQEAPKAAKAEAQAKSFERDFAPASSKEGGVYLKDGTLYRVESGSGVALEEVEKLSAPQKAWMADYIPLRDALKQAQKDQLQEGDWEKSLAALGKAYDKFVKKHGPIKDFSTRERKTTDEDGEETVTTYRVYKNDKMLSMDVEGVLVEALEKITDEGEIIKAPFLLGRTLNKPVRREVVTAEDALAVTLDEIGRVDLAYAAKEWGKTEAELTDALGDSLYQDPDGTWQTADEYLSGNVLEKLEAAQLAADADPRFERNVTALRAVQPRPLGSSDITVKLGAGWVPVDVVESFVSEVLDVDNVSISYMPTRAAWEVDGAKQRFRRNAAHEYGTDERSPLELLDAILNNRTIKVYHPKDSDGKTLLNQNATEAANQMAKKIADKFRSWVWTDGKRTTRLLELYNTQFNNIAPRSFNGDHLTFPGLSTRYVLRPHQKRAVWRQIQAGNTYLAHAVGAGKTLEMIVGGMEQRRLGLIKKPMYVVPNHMLKQFAFEFLEAYPAANIMVADEKAFHTSNRKRFMAQAALNDPDAIIITHSSFGRIGTGADAEAIVVDDMMAELEEALEQAKGDGVRHTRTKIENQIEKLKQRVEAKRGGPKDGALTFEEMGVDMLYVDEAHEFRKLDFATNRNAKGIDGSGSARALDLFVKTRWLDQQNPGRSVVLASGTPVTNTMAELYTVMRYMAQSELQAAGIAHFDAWANQFGEISAALEREANGDYKMVERFNKFVNVPDLMKRVRMFMDVLTSDQLGDVVKRPKIIGGGPKNLVTPPISTLEEYMAGPLSDRIEKSKAWKPSKDQPYNPDPIIAINGDALLSSIDMRFVYPHLKNDPKSKLNQMIDQIIETHFATKDRVFTDPVTGKPDLRKGAAQIVFSPVGFGDMVAQSRGFSAQEWINQRLKEAGVKASEIGWLLGGMSHAKKAQLQKDVREGKVRILFGTPKSMGTGLNVQKRLYELHYLSPPWYPSDVEQPHGRIERQGNQHEEISIKWYAVEGTYEATAWTMVTNKARFIQQALAGDESVRVIEDISAVSQYEMAAALAAGDDRVIRAAELGNEIDKFERLKSAHYTTQRRIAGEKRYLEKSMPNTEARIADLQEAKGLVKLNMPFAMDVGGTSFDKHGEAGKALLDSVGTILSESIAVPTRDLATFQGFPVRIQPANRVGDSFELAMQIGKIEVEVLSPRDIGSIEDLDPVGVAKRIQNSLLVPTSELRSEEAKLAEDRKQVEQIDKKLGAPFEDEAKLSEMIAERAQLQDALASETAAKDAAREARKAPKQQAQPRDNKSAHTSLVGKTALLRGELQEQFKRFGIDDRIALKVSNGISRGQGQYWRKAISVSLDIAVNPSATLSHETIHAMRDLGLFTDAEWKSLVSAAWANPTYRDFASGPSYAGLLPTERREEAAAEMFADWWENFYSPTRGLWERAAWRIARFVAALSAAVHKVIGRPLPPGLAAHLVMLDIARGKIGSRPTNGGTAQDIAREQVPIYAKPAPNIDLTPTIGEDGLATWTEEQRAEADRWLKEHYPDNTMMYAVSSPELGGGRERQHIVGDMQHARREMLRMLADLGRYDESYQAVLDWYGQDTTIGGVKVFRGNVAEMKAEGIRFQAPPQPAVSFDGETEERWLDARLGIGSGPGVVERSREWFEDLKNGFTRHWKHLPNEARFSDLQQQFRKLEAAPEDAMDKSIRYLRDVVKDMSREEYDLFSRKVVLDDLAWEAGAEHELPFGFTPETLRSARSQVDRAIDGNAKLIAAIRRRKEYNREVANAMVEAGVLTRQQIKNPAYFRHMVLDYARHEAKMARQPGNKLKSPYWAKRLGSTLDINANYLEAELDWLLKARIDTATANTLDWIKESDHNIRDRLRAQAKASNKAIMAEVMAGDPAAAKIDGQIRSNIARGLGIVKQELGDLDVPSHLQDAADDLVNDVRDGETPFALLAWILDNKLPGSMGAAMVLKYIGLRKQWMREVLGDRYIDPDDIKGLVHRLKPEGFTTWQPKDGQHLFTAKTISEGALDMFVGKLSESSYPGVDKAELHRALTTVRDQLVVGGDRYTMVLPEEVAATLDEFGDRRARGMVAQVFGGIQSAWKRWVLINPRRWLKYNINNLSGDLDAIIAGNPGTLSKIPQAWRELRAAAKGQPSLRYEEAHERGVFTSGLSVQEIPDINMLAEFRNLTENRGAAREATIGSLAKVWRALQDSTNFREALFRHAAYLDYIEKIEAGKPMSEVGYGASLPSMVDAVSDPVDKAALLARDLVGDYGAISSFGSGIRSYVIPFWSWMEINTRRYWRLTGNAYRQSKAKGLAVGGLLGAGAAARSAVWLAIRAGAVYGMIQLWNNMFFPDEEDDLGDLQQQQLHLILGRDDAGEIKTLRLQGALSDVMGTFGLTDAMAAFQKYRDGQGSLGSIFTDMVKAPVNRVATSTTPLFSVPVELMLGEKLWPDAFNARPIHDTWRHVLSTFSLENEYDAVAERPSRGYGRSWAESLIYRRDPGEMAFDTAKGLAYDWLREVKGRDGGFASSPRSDALRDYRAALRYGDGEAADAALIRYADAGGTDKDLATSIKRQHPLGPIAKKDRAAFLESLTDEQLETFALAEEWYREVYVGEPKAE